jgi:hypothetical protein
MLVDAVDKKESWILCLYFTNQPANRNQTLEKQMAGLAKPPTNRAT